VEHSPNPVRAQLGGRSGYKYTWLYETTVRSTPGRVRVTEFGSFGWFDGKWVFANYTNKPFTSAEFSEWYACDNAEILPNTSYSDGKNWTGADELRDGRTKWY